MPGYAWRVCGLCGRPLQTNHYLFSSSLRLVVACLRLVTLLVYIRVVFVAGTCIVLVIAGALKLKNLVLMLVPFPLVSVASFRSARVFLNFAALVPCRLQVCHLSIRPLLALELVFLKFSL